jgi:hydrogenase/urease accessory protein HupE
MTDIIFYNKYRSDIRLLKSRENNMEKLARTIISVICLLLAPVVLLAHPGHGHESPLSPGHYIANPEHFLPLALTIAALLIAVLVYRRYRDYLKQNK